MGTGSAAGLTLAGKAVERDGVARLLGRTYRATESLLSRASVAFREALARLERETDIAVAGALVALVCLIVLSLLRRTVTAETGETRRSVEATLAQIEALQPASLDDAAFREAIVQAREAPCVAAVWLFTPDGRIVQGNRAFSQGTVETSATAETRRMLAALPSNTISAQRSVQLDHEQQQPDVQQSSDSGSDSDSGSGPQMGSFLPLRAA